MPVDLLGFSVTSQKPSQNTHASHPAQLFWHTCICCTLSLTNAHVTTLPACQCILAASCTRVNRHWLLDDQTVLHQLSNLLPRVGVCDLIGLIWVQPYLLLATAQNAGCQPLLKPEHAHGWNLVAEDTVLCHVPHTIISTVVYLFWKLMKMIIFCVGIFFHLPFPNIPSYDIQQMFPLGFFHRLPLRSHSMHCSWKANRISRKCTYIHTHSCHFNRCFRLWFTQASWRQRGPDIRKGGEKNNLKHLLAIQWTYEQHRNLVNMATKVYSTLLIETINTLLSTIVSHNHWHYSEYAFTDIW